jgi:hypothetical protein
MNKKVETIDCTPTWPAVCQMLLTVLENGTEEGKKVAKAELMNMAKIAQAYLELQKASKPVLLGSIPTPDMV